MPRVTRVERRLGARPRARPMSPNVMSSVEPPVQFRTRSWIDAAIKLMNRTGPHDLVDHVRLAHPHRERSARALRDLKLVDEAPMGGRSAREAVEIQAVEGTPSARTAMTVSYSCGVIRMTSV
jgi:hypothetical protein